MLSPKQWPPSEIEQLKELYPDTTALELAKRFRCSTGAVYRKARSLGLKKSAAFNASPASGRIAPGDARGINGRFTPGRRPHNAGVKSWKAGGNAERTQFKPGTRNGRAEELYQPIGVERVTKDGYLERKVNDDLPLQRRWQMVHRLVWEEHNGPIPKGHAIVFRNGDKRDLRVDNLELVSRRDLMRRNSVHTLPKELATICQLKGALQRQINKRTRTHEKQD